MKVETDLSSPSATSAAVAVDLLRVWGMSRAELERLLRTGHALAPGALAGGSYRGVSLGLGTLVEKLTWKVFRKTFDASGTGGHNVRLQQGGPLSPLRDGGTPGQQLPGQAEFGPFEVKSLDDTPAGRFPRGVLLDYGARHPGWHPLARLRDPLVALVPGSVEVLLGKSYVEVLGRWVSTPSYFTLERERGARAADGWRTRVA